MDPAGALRLGFFGEIPYLPELASEGMIATAQSGLPACWEPFLAELKARRSPFAKVQLAGPVTVGIVLEEKAVAMVHAVRQTGAAPLFFIDEPGLAGAGDLTGLRRLVDAVRGAGAVVGLHCCANADWARVLGLGPDVLSFDARLSLDAVLADPVAVRASGVALALGVVPTNLGATYVLAELVDAIEVSLRSTGCLEVELLLTPACGVAGHSVAEAERIHREVGQAQEQLRHLLQR